MALKNTFQREETFTYDLKNRKISKQRRQDFKNGQFFLDCWSIELEITIQVLILPGLTFCRASFSHTTGLI